MKKILIFISVALSLNSVFSQNAMKTDSAYKCIKISADDFHSLILAKKDIKIIDVRLPAEFRPERIEHALNIPVLKISEKKTRKLNKEAFIVLYCAYGIRSCKAAVKMHELGFQNIYSLSGGIRDWKANGMPVVSRKHTKDIAERKDPPQR